MIHIVNNVTDFHFGYICQDSNSMNQLFRKLHTYTYERVITILDSAVIILLYTLKKFQQMVLLRFNFPGDIAFNRSCDNAAFATFALFLSTTSCCCSALNNCLLFNSARADGRVIHSGAIISRTIICNSCVVFGMGNSLPCRISCHSFPFSGRGRFKQISYIVAPRENMSLFIFNVMMAIKRETCY